MCAILSVKGGRCTENCKFCAQSSCSSADIPSFEVRDADYVAEDAKRYDGIGVARYCQVSSGRRLNKRGLRGFIIISRAVRSTLAIFAVPIRRRIKSK